MWFSKKKPSPAEVTGRLREQALTIAPPELAAPNHDGRAVWGVLMDTPQSGATVTLMSLADGTTSLYFSTGGGIIGAGQHESVRAASAALMSIAESLRTQFAAATDHDTPTGGQVRFFLRTVMGLMVADADERVLSEKAHPLWPLFYACHGVIAAIREVSPPQ